MAKIFISHASEDKKAIAAPLAEELHDRNHEIWYDQMSLVAGDTLLKKIEEGIKDCDFGVVVLSDHYFEKAWTELEWQALATKEIANQNNNSIIPVWYNITLKGVAANSLFLAGKLGIDGALEVTEIANQIERSLEGDKADLTKPTENAFNVSQLADAIRITNEMVTFYNKNQDKIDKLTELFTQGITNEVLNTLKQASEPLTVKEIIEITGRKPKRVKRVILRLLRQGVVKSWIDFDKKVTRWEILNSKPIDYD